MIQHKVVVMPFIQVIEFQTSQIDAFNAVLDEWSEKSTDWRTPTRAVLTQDRDRPNTYVQIVEFPSYEKAMENSARPETTQFAERLSALCDGTPTFRNLDVLRDEGL